MFRFYNRLFNYKGLHNTNKAIKILTLSDAFFYSGMALVDVIFGVFIIQQIPNATIATLGVGHAIFMIGIVITEPLLSKFYDVTKKPSAPFYGFIIGNFMKVILRLCFVFIKSVPAFYLIYLFLGFAHSIEAPSFYKIFTKHVNKGEESIEWGSKDALCSLTQVITLFLSGYIALFFGYQFLFILSSTILLISGVIVPLLYKKELA